MSYFYFAGQSCLDFGLHIESYPHYTTARRRITTQEVPGRNGLLVYDSESYDNVDGYFEVYVNATASNTMAAGREISTWLQGNTGYQRLEDAYDTEVYRMATFTGPVDFSNFFQRYGKATLTFSCMPQRFFKSGESLLKLSNGVILRNYWMCAKPLIQVSGSGQGILYFNDCQVTISSIPSGGITLDCDTENAYQGTDNLNGLVTVSNEGFPRLVHGDTQIRWSGGITSVSIYPRWWAL